MPYKSLYIIYIYIYISEFIYIFHIITGCHNIKKIFLNAKE